MKKSCLIAVSAAVMSVSAAGTDRLSYWIANTNRIPYTTTFLLGAEACKLTSGGRLVVRPSAEPGAGRLGGHTNVPKGTTRFDLELNRSKPDVEIGVSVYDSIGLEFKDRQE